VSGVSRRRLLVGGGAALFVQAGCGGDDGGEAPAAGESGGSGPWEFTDDRGKNEPHWEVLSWERAGKYPADVILYDSRNPSYFTTDLSRYPTVANLPAVKANQAIAWNPETPSTWAAFGAAIRDLTGKLSVSKTVA